MRYNQRQLLRQVHYVKEHRLARASRTLVQAKFLWGHDTIVPVAPHPRHSCLAGALNTIPRQALSDTSLAVQRARYWSFCPSNEFSETPCQMSIFKKISMIGAGMLISSLADSDETAG